MTIDIKKLQKIITLCRKNGVLEIESGDLRLKLSSKPLPQKQRLQPKQAEATEQLEFTPPYSEEDTLFWSSSGLPGVN